MFWSIKKKKKQQREELGRESRRKVLLEENAALVKISLDIRTNRLKTAVAGLPPELSRTYSRCGTGLLLCLVEGRIEEIKAILCTTEGKS